MPTPMRPDNCVLKPGWLRDDMLLAARRVANNFPTPREGRLESALKDIAELAAQNGPEWTSRRALRALE